MGFFKKKKSNNVNNDVNNVGYIPKPVEVKEPTLSEEQVGMEQARVTLDNLVEQLKEMQMYSFQTEMQEAAVKNESMADENQRILDEARQEEKANMDENSHSVRLEKLERRAKIEEGLYILPEDLEKYQEKINVVTSIFESYTAADTRSTGADEIDKLLSYYIKKFQDSLRDGQKLKADACWELLKYAVFVAHNKAPEGKNPEEQKKVLERRKQIVEKTFNSIILTVDRIYGNLYSLTVSEKTYNNIYMEYADADKELDSIPEEYKDVMETLGYQGAMEKYPPDHPIRAYVDMEIHASGVLSNVELQSLYIERLIADIHKLKRNLIFLMSEFEKQCGSEQGINYDDKEVAQEINRISDAVLREINSMYNQQLEAYEMSRNLSSKVAAAASNEDWGKAAIDSRERRKIRRDLENENNNFQKLKAKHAASIQKDTIENVEEAEKIEADMG